MGGGCRTGDPAELYRLGLGLGARKGRRDVFLGGIVVLGGGATQGLY
jgi:hypothetical protein